MITSDWNKINSKKYDLITMYAVLEHLNYPSFDYGSITKLIKIGGYLIITTSTKLSKPVLEFLSYKLGIVSKKEIREHKHYFNIIEIEKYSTRII